MFAFITAILLKAEPFQIYFLYDQFQNTFPNSNIKMTD